MVSSVNNSALLSALNGQAALSLFGSSSGSGGTDLTSVLTSYYAAKSGAPAASTTAANAPTAPWVGGGTPSVGTAVLNAINGSAFIDPSSAKLDAPAGGSTSDYKNLFALYQGLNTMYDLAQTAVSTAGSANPPVRPAQLQTAFASGMSQVQTFVGTTPFDGFNVTAGKVSASQQSAVGIPNGAGHTYTTGIMATGDRGAIMPTLQGDVQFSIGVKNAYATTTITNGGVTTTVTQPPTTVNIDLAGMGSTARTLDNVVNYINTQLKAADVQTRFSVASLGNATKTTLAGGKTTTTKGDAQWGLTVNGASGEAISFSAPSTAAAVYVAEGTGGAKTVVSGKATTTATGEQLVGFETGNNAVGTPPSVTSVSANNTNLASGGIFSTGLPDGVSGVKASAVGPDGAVYMIANVSGSVSGAPVPGTQGVALLKYDSAGKLLSTKVLADGANASGYSIAINADGSVAVAGANATAATSSASGLVSAATTTAFVQVFGPTGAPSWSATMPAGHGTSQASGVAFGSDGSVYVSGTTTGSVGGQTTVGDSDEFIQGYTKAGKATFTTQYGATGGESTSSGIVYDSASDSLITAGLENSKAVVRSFILNGTHPPDDGAVRNLGAASSVVGIALNGSQVVVGGNVNAATIHADTVAQAFKGTADSFIAAIGTDLSSQPSDTVTYMGISGATQTATAMTVAGGQAYLTGTVANDPNSLSSSGATEGFVAGVDAGTGAVSYSKLFSAAGGQAAPTAIAVSTTGTSVLNQLGLPAGQLNAAGSTLITANTPIKAGDKFYVRTTPGGPQTAITITATDTLTTLANKLNAVLGSHAKAKVIALGANSQLNITPASADDFIELDSQPSHTGAFASTTSSTDVLSALGLNSGVIRQVKTINGLTDVKQLREYGLGLSSNLNLTTKASAQQAANALQAAMTAIKNAYTALATPPTMASEAAAKAQGSGGSAPAYLTKETAGYQAALLRLTGGQATSA